MSDDLVTRETPPEPRAEDGTRQVPALVVVWSPHEPWRIGEVLLFPDNHGAGGGDRVFGRGAAVAGRLVLHRQRPGELVPTAPIAAEEISREALLVNRMAVGLTVRRGAAQRAVRVNGEEIGDYRLLEPGDTVEIDRQIMFLYTHRPEVMRALRYGRADMPFGEADRHGMIGESPGAWRLRDQLAWAAQMRGHVFIHGESGTGKELAAGAIHRATGSAGMFVSHSAATVPSSLLDAELFGNARNYPNPGMVERPGLVGMANGGTLFLDEIGEMPHELHAHLLRVLDAGEYKRLGESQARRSTFRLIAATNRDRSALKHDFLARLGIEVDLPSFRDRREDIPLLARAMVLDVAKHSPATAECVTKVAGREEPRFAASLIQHLVRLHYETNARELLKVLNRAMQLPVDGVLLLPQVAAEGAAGSGSMPPPTSLPVQAATASSGPRPPSDAEGVRRALAEANGNVSQAARTLELSRPALYRLIEKYGLK